MALASRPNSQQHSTQESSPRAGAQRPKVVYVMGAGRSGSTILGLALGNCANMLYAGELDKWLLRSGVSPLPGDERARFWSSVRAHVRHPRALADGRARPLERSSDLLRIARWRARRRLRPDYRDISERLFSTIARTAGVSHVVDTSHYPLRARELQSLKGIDLYLVFLVRDPHSVVASFRREDVPEPTFPVHTSNAYLWLTHLLCVFVFLRHRADRRVFVRYEDFVSNPQKVLAQILQRIDAASPLPDFNALDTGVPFQGNRLVRSSEPIAIRRDGDAPVPSSPMTSVLQLPWRLVLSRMRPAASP